MVSACLFPPTVRNMSRNNRFTFRFSSFTPFADLEWKVIYVGSAQDSSKDQVLDEILVGPVPVGTNKFVLMADPPNPGLLPADEILGVTVVLVTCSYKEREFLRVGYYVNNEYTLELVEGEAPPLYPQLDLQRFVQRQILAEKPRVTKFPISWTNGTGVNDKDANPATDQGNGNAMNGVHDMNSTSIMLNATIDENTTSQLGFPASMTNVGNGGARAATSLMKCVTSGIVPDNHFENSNPNNTRSTALGVTPSGQSDVMDVS
jgi:histone chaperone ASF1